MKFRFFFTIVFGLALSLALPAQDSSSGQVSGQAQDRTKNITHPVPGTVIAAGADSYTVQTQAGFIYTVNCSAKTRMFKPQSERNRPGARRDVGNPGHFIMPGDINVGDFIAAMGDFDPDTKTVTAKAVRKFDADQVMQIRDKPSDYNRTWLAGEVKAVTGARIMLLGSLDHTPHVIVANVDTAFRRHHEAIPLTDIKAGDTVHVEGSVQNGNFVASEVVAVDKQAPPPTVPRAAPPPTQPSTPPPTPPSTQPLTPPSTQPQ